jgi:hypothetical protein
MQNYLYYLKKILQSSTTRALCRVIVGGVFLYTGIGHLKYPFGFEDEVLQYNLLPQIAIPVFAQVMPWLEVFASSLFLFNIMPIVSGSILFFLLLMYVGAIGINILRGVWLTDCGCVAGLIFPSEVEGLERTIQSILGKTSLEALVRDLVLLGMTSIVLLQFALVKQFLRKCLRVGLSVLKK